MLKEKLAAQFDFLKAKAPPLVGCDISSSSVKMVEIAEAGRNVYRVERYAIEPLPKDTVVDGNIANIEAAGEAIKRAHKALGSRVSVRHTRQTVDTREQQTGGNALTQDTARQSDMPVEEAEAAKRVGNLPENFGPDVLQPFNEKIVLEIQRALQFFFTSTQFSKVDHILLTGGCAMLDGLEEMVAQRTQVHTVVANPFANMALSSKIKPRQLTIDAPSLMVACGLAMRRFDPS